MAQLTVELGRAEPAIGNGGVFIGQGESGHAGIERHLEIPARRGVMGGHGRIAEAEAALPVHAVVQRLVGKREALLQVRRRRGRLGSGLSRRSGDEEQARYHQDPPRRHGENGGRAERGKKDHT